MSVSALLFFFLKFRVFSVIMYNIIYKWISFICEDQCLLVATVFLVHGDVISFVASSENF